MSISDGAFVFADDSQSKNEDHHAFARYYLHTLSEPAKKNVPREEQLTRLILRNTHMKDTDVDALCVSLTKSFENNGPALCSLSVLEEIDISFNPLITTFALTRLFDTLRYISSVEKESKENRERFSPSARHLQTLSIVSEVEQRFLLSHEKGRESYPSENRVTLPSSQEPQNGDACNALWRIDASQDARLSQARTTRALATSVVRFLRISRSLFDVKLPDGDHNERSVLEAEEKIERESSRNERILKRIILPTDEEYLPVPHPLDDRPFFWFDDIPMNAALNKFPFAMKKCILASMVRRTNDALTLMNASAMDLSCPTTIDDTMRVNPKVYSVESAAFLAEVLSNTSLVTMVDLSNNNKGDDATIALSSFLFQNKSVVELRLRSNNVSTKGGLALAEAIRNNSSLVELDLSDNSCSDVVAAAFRDLIVLNTAKIGFVNWENNCVSLDLVQDVNYRLMLNTQPKLVKETVLRLKQRDPQMTRVLWNGYEPTITDDTVKVLMQSIRGNDIVTHIDVSCSKITDEGARHLSDIVRSCSKLRTLIAQSNYITDEGALVLLHSIPESKSLARLDLKFQQPREISTKILKSIEQVSNLGNQPFEIRKHGLALVVNDPDCTEINLSVSDGETKVSDETVKTLTNLMGNNTHVLKINLSGNRFKVTGRCLPTFVEVALHLTHLDLSGLYLKDEDVIPTVGHSLLGRNPSPALLELNLSDNNLTRSTSYELAIIARNQNDTIRLINFDKNHAISNQDREVVDFYCGVNRYAKAFKNIVLDVEANDKPKLTELNFTVLERVSDKGTSHRFSKDFDDHSVKLICTALAQNSTVNKVIFSGNRCTDVGATYWAQLLRVNVNINHLDISFNNINVLGLSEIAQSLELSHTVSVFRFEGNPGAKDEKISRRLFAAARKSAAESLEQNSCVYAKVHSVTNTQHSKTLQLNLVQAAALDKKIEEVIMVEALSGYNSAQQTRKNQKEKTLSFASRKDASSILLPLYSGASVNKAAGVPSTSDSLAIEQKSNM